MHPTGSEYKVHIESCDCTFVVKCYGLFEKIVIFMRTALRIIMKQFFDRPVSATISQLDLRVYNCERNRRKNIKSSKTGLFLNWEGRLFELEFITF